MEVEDHTNFKSGRKDRDNSASLDRQFNLMRGEQLLAGNLVVPEQIYEEDQESGRLGDLSIVHNN